MLSVKECSTVKKRKYQQEIKTKQKKRKEKKRTNAKESLKLKYLQYSPAKADGAGHLETI